MSETKNIIDEYAVENAGLKQQVENLLMTLRDAVFVAQDEKGQLRVPGSTRKKAEKFGLEIKQLKTSVVLTLKQLEE